MGENRSRKEAFRNDQQTGVDGRGGAAAGGAGGDGRGACQRERGAQKRAGRENFAEDKCGLHSVSNY